MPRLFCFSLIALVLCAGVRAQTWVRCDGCSDAGMRQLATNVPADRFGVSVINVIDADAESARGFRVQVFFDYEFRSWMRFATPVSLTAQANAQLQSWRTLRAGVRAAMTASVAIDAPAVSDILTAPHSLDQPISNALSEFGVPRTSISLGSLADYAFNQDEALAFRFNDGSRAALTLTGWQQGALRWRYIENSMTDDTDTVLPDSDADVRGFDEVVTAQHADRLQSHLHRVWDVPVWLDNARRELAQRYRVICDWRKDEIVCRSIS